MNLASHTETRRHPRADGDQPAGIMNTLNHLRAGLLLLGLLVALRPLPSSAQSSKERDSQHDFDFEIGAWKTHLSRLLHPLSGSTTWAEYEGTTTVVRKIWDGC